MNKVKLETRRKLKNIVSVKEFYDLLDSTMLSEEERNIMIMYYKDKKSLSYIADIMGISEPCIKCKHDKLLEKFAKVI